MRILTVIIVALALAGPAAADGFAEAQALEPAASWVAGKPVKVWCGVVRNGQSYEGGVTKAGGSDIYLMPEIVCAPLVRLTDGQPVVSGDAGTALGVLVHEAEHARGIVDEAETECASLKVTAEAAIRFFGLRGQRKYLRSLMAMAWAQHRARPAAYTRLCP